MWQQLPGGFGGGFGHKFGPILNLLLEESNAAVSGTSDG